MTATAALPSITPYQMYDTMLKHDPENRVILFNGDPGIGKTEIPKQAAAAERQKCHVILGSQMEPTDISGIPFPDFGEQHALFLAHKMFTDIKDYEWVLVDEINRARVEMQNAMMQFILDRRAGAKKLGKNVKMFATANPPSPQHMVFPISAPLLNRMIVINVVADSEDWIAWAAASGINPIVIAFISKNPDALCPVYDSSKHIPTEFNPWPSPRAWVSVSLTIAENNIRAIERAKIIGAVGTEYGARFITFQSVGYRVPDIDRLIDGLDTFPTDADLAYISTYASVTRIMERTVKAGINDPAPLCNFMKTFLDRGNGWPAEAVAVVANIVSRNVIAKSAMRNAIRAKNKHALAFARSDAVVALTDESQGLDDGN